VLESVPLKGLFPQGASQAGMVVKNPRAEREDAFSIFCGYQRILSGGSKRNDCAFHCSDVFVINNLLSHSLA
jgi:hypothetical protein